MLNLKAVAMLSQILIISNSIHCKLSLWQLDQDHRMNSFYHLLFAGKVYELLGSIILVQTFIAGPSLPQDIILYIQF